MQFEIRKRAFSLGASYTIKDAQGNPTYTVRSTVLSIGHQLDLLDLAGNGVAHVQQRVLSLAPDYEISRDGQLVAEVRRDLVSFVHPHFTVQGPGGTYDIHGDWRNWNYTVERDGQQVARIGEQLALTDTYAVDIAEGADIPIILCLVIVLDEVTHQVA